MTNYQLKMKLREDYLQLSSKIAVEEFALKTLQLSPKEHGYLEEQLFNMKQLRDSYLKRATFLSGNSKND